MNAMQKMKALGELLQLQSEGLKLPMPAYQIVEIEAQGGVVNLETGEVTYGTADCDRFSLTEKGKESLNHETD